jgi:hypothetical protein
VTAPISWRVVHFDGLSPDEDPYYRGPGVMAVPGDIVRVSTPDGDFDG